MKCLTDRRREPERNGREKQQKKISRVSWPGGRFCQAGSGAETAMSDEAIRERLDAYVKRKYGVEPEILPFSKENYTVYRHADTGKWFAVFIVKERSVFGLEGEGEAEVVSVKVKDPLLADYLMQQPGYLRGYPSSKWNWVTMLLDGTVPFEEICRWVDDSCRATKTKAKNMRTPLVKRESWKRENDPEE